MRPRPWWAGPLLLAIVAGPVTAGRASCDDTNAPPVAARRPRATFFGKTAAGVEPGLEQRGESPMDPPIQRRDPYYWLRDDERQDDEVLELLRQENAHMERHTAHQSALRKLVERELIGRLQETDETARESPHNPHSNLNFNPAPVNLNFKPEFQCSPNALIQ